MIHYNRLCGNFFWRVYYLFYFTLLQKTQLSLFVSVSPSCFLPSRLFPPQNGLLKTYFFHSFSSNPLPQNPGLSPSPNPVSFRVPPLLFLLFPPRVFFPSLFFGSCPGPFFFSWSPFIPGLWLVCFKSFSWDSKKSLQNHLFLKKSRFPPCSCMN